MSTEAQTIFSRFIILIINGAECRVSLSQNIIIPVINRLNSVRFSNSDKKLFQLHHKLLINSFDLSPAKLVKIFPFTKETSCFLLLNAKIFPLLIEFFQN